MTENQELKCQFGNMQLSPLSCRGLRHVINRELQFTIQVEGSLESQISSESYKSKSSDFVDKVQLYQDRCFCVNCGQKLLADHCLFSRVLPLPSENWSDFSDIWFCHKHEDDEDYDHHQKISLLPKSHECFIADTYLLIRSDRLKLGYTKAANDIIYCKRCGGKLGHIHGNKPKENEDNVKNDDNNAVYKLYRHSVLFCALENHDMSTSSLSEESEDYFANLILEQSHLYTCFKLLLEAEAESRKISCLIWLIDPSLIIFHGKEHSSTKLCLQPQKVLKILYKCYIEKEKRSTAIPKNGDMLQSWQTDNTVHSFNLPYPMALHLMTCLINNTKCMPRSQRYLSDFHVGYLKYRPCQSDMEYS